MDVFYHNYQMIGIVVVVAFVCLILYYLCYNGNEKLVSEHQNNKKKVHFKEPTHEETTPIVSLENQPMPMPSSNKVLVMFSMPGCGHCRNMEPTWQELEQNFNGFNGVKIVKINGMENQELSQLHNVRGFPTVKLCINGVENPDGVVYEGDRSMDSLVEFLKYNS